MMEFKRYSNYDCQQAAGLVVVIDVLRAFSTAAYAFAAGARQIILVSSVEQAFQIKREMPEAHLMGEIDGYPIEGFEFGNSPSQIVSQDLTDAVLIHRSSAGTQGVVRSQRAESLLATSFCCARATADFILAAAPRLVSFVISGLQPDGRGDEDQACSEYIQALLERQQPDPAPYIRRVIESKNGGLFRAGNQPAFPLSDLDYCTAVDRFNFAMPVWRENGLHIMQPVTMPFRPTSSL
ncbi:MAG TPA: 2-phosphosulfolactate phosphatase [Anaerolineaceae bacterium]|nr:2-phosphosulfolactate phosphatase [Anaerolineaceae bacterium]